MINLDARIRQVRRTAIAQQRRLATTSPKARPIMNTRPPTQGSSQRRSTNASYSEDRTELDNYKIVRHIGKGAYANVRLVTHKITNDQYAIKTYERARMFDKHRQMAVKREIQIMGKLSHPNIVRFKEKIETFRQYHLVMEFINGMSLNAYLKRKDQNRLSEQDCKNVFLQITQAVAYLHENKIAHRDLKLDNILININTNKVKLIDFGFSTMIQEDVKSKMFWGTPNYMAPEITAKKEYFGNQTDVWALGVLLFVLLCGTFPFKSYTNDIELFRKIQRGAFHIPKHVSRPARDLLSSILMTDPDKRLTAREIIESAWLSNRQSMTVVSPMRQSDFRPMTTPTPLAGAGRRTMTVNPNPNCIDINILGEMVKLGYHEDQVREAVNSQKTSHLSTLYSRLIGLKSPSFTSQKKARICIQDITQDI